MSSAAQDFAERVAATYGERPRWHGREMRVRCPVHEAQGAHNPSLAVWNGPLGAPRWKCMTGCPRAAVQAALRARGVPISKAAPMSTGDQLAARRQNELRRVEQLTKSRDALMYAQPIAAGDASDIYLKSRGLDIAGDPAFDYLTVSTGPDPSHAGGVAMLGVIVDLTTLPRDMPRATGLMALSLMPDGTPRLGPDGKKFRSIVGTQSGYGVALGKPGPRLVVGEGIETTLSAMKLLAVPFGVAVLSASNMAPLAVPEWVDHVIIAADNDTPGLAAARSLQDVLRKAGCPCGIMSLGEPDTGWDANDELMARQKKGS